MSTTTTPTEKKPIDLAALPNWLHKVDPFTLLVDIQHEGETVQLQVQDPKRSYVYTMMAALDGDSCKKDSGMSEAAQLRAYVSDPSGKLLPDYNVDLNQWKSHLGDLRNAMVSRIAFAISALQESVKEVAEGN